MKKIRFISILALFLCAVMLLASCGGKSGKVKELAFQKVGVKSTVEDATVAFAAVDALKGYETYNSTNAKVSNYVNYPFVVLYQENATDATKLDKVVIYNVEQNAIVWTYSGTKLNESQFSMTLQSDNPTDRAAYFWVYIDDNTGAKEEEQTTLYNASGTSIATAKSDTAPSRKFDLISFDKNYYRLSDAKTNTITKVDYSPLNGALPNIFAANEDYYYARTASSYDIYDKDLKLVTSYYVEGDPDSTEAMVLKNGNLAVQLRYKLPADTDDYTYFDGTDKIAMKTVIVNAKNGKTTTASFNYYLIYGYSINVDYDNGKIEENALKKDFYSQAYVYSISEDRILMAEEQQNAGMLLAVNAKMKVLGRLDAMVDNQMPGTFVDNICPGYFRVQLANGKTVLLNEKGKVIGNITGATGGNYSYILSGGKIFDYALNELFDYEEQEYSPERAYNHSVILSKVNDGTTEYYIYTNGALTQLTKKGDNKTIVFENNFYLIKDNSGATTVIRYYNDKNELVLTLDGASALSSVKLGKHFALYERTEDSKTVYYRVTF